MTATDQQAGESPPLKKQVQRRKPKGDQGGRSKLRPTVAHIAEKLDEKNLKHTWWIVLSLGEERSLELLARTLEIEAQGGMLIASGERRRTPGGVFFYLANPEAGEKSARWRQTERDQEAARLRAHQTWIAEQIAAHWPQRQQALADLVRDGVKRARKMRVTLTGRPSKVVDQGAYVMTILRAPHPTEKMPDDLPPIPDSNLAYVVYIPKSHWERVEKRYEADGGDVLALQPHWELSITGFLTYDSGIKKMSLFARAVNLQRIEPS